MEGKLWNILPLSKIAIFNFKGILREFNIYESGCYKILRYNWVSHVGQEQPHLLISVFYPNTIIFYVFHCVNKDGKYWSELKHLKSMFCFFNNNNKIWFRCRLPKIHSVHFYSFFLFLGLKTFVSSVRIIKIRRSES